MAPATATTYTALIASCAERQYWGEGAGVCYLAEGQQSTPGANEQGASGRVVVLPAHSLRLPAVRRQDRIIFLSASLCCLPFFDLPPAGLQNPAPPRALPPTWPMSYSAACCRTAFPSTLGRTVSDRAKGTGMMGAVRSGHPSRWWSLGFRVPELRWRCRLAGSVGRGPNHPHPVMKTPGEPGRACPQGCNALLSAYTAAGRWQQGQQPGCPWPSARGGSCQPLPPNGLLQRAWQRARHSSNAPHSTVWHGAVLYQTQSGQK